MAALRPIHVGYILELGVAAFVGHKGILHAKVQKTVYDETRPAALKTPLAIGTRDFQNVETDIGVEAILLNFGAVSGVAEVGSVG